MVNSTIVIAVVVVVVLALVGAYYGGILSPAGEFTGRNVAVRNTTPPPSQTHLDCVGMACVQVSGAGNNLCATNADCSHLECVGQACQTVAGAGQDQCQSDANCTLPDLTVISLAFGSGGCGGGNGTNATCNVSVDAVVKNIGNASADWSYTRLEVVGYGDMWTYTSSLAPGQQVTVSNQTIIAPGNHILHAFADISNRIAESNEDNNNLTVSDSV